MRRLNRGSLAAARHSAFTQSLRAEFSVTTTSTQSHFSRPASMAWTYFAPGGISAGEYQVSMLFWESGWRMRRSTKSTSRRLWLTKMRIGWSGFRLFT